MAISGLIPSRFLCLTAHLVTTISILWSRDENIKACLPDEYTAPQYEDKNTEFIVALSLTLAGLALEYFGLLGGISTFMPSVGLASTCLHSAACVALAFFIWDVWDCDYYWFIWGFCSAPSAFLEIGAIISIWGLKNV